MEEVAGIVVVLAACCCAILVFFFSHPWKGCWEGFVRTVYMVGLLAAAALSTLVMLAVVVSKSLRDGAIASVQRLE